MTIDEVWKEMESEFRSRWINDGDIREFSQEFKAEIIDKEGWSYCGEIKLILFPHPDTDLQNDPDPIFVARNIEIKGIRHQEKEFSEWDINIQKL